MPVARACGTPRPIASPAPTWVSIANVTAPAPPIGEATGATTSLVLPVPRSTEGGAARIRWAADGGPKAVVVVLAADGPMNGDGAAFRVYVGLLLAPPRE